MSKNLFLRRRKIQKKLDLHSFPKEFHYEANAFSNVVFRRSPTPEHRHQVLDPLRRRPFDALPPETGTLRLIHAVEQTGNVYRQFFEVVFLSRIERVESLGLPGFVKVTARELDFQ